MSKIKLNLTSVYLKRWHQKLSKLNIGFELANQNNSFAPCGVEE